MEKHAPCVSGNRNRRGPPIVQPQVRAETRPVPSSHTPPTVVRSTHAGSHQRHSRSKDREAASQHLVAFKDLDDEHSKGLARRPLASASGLNLHCALCRQVGHGAENCPQSESGRRPLDSHQSLPSHSFPATTPSTQQSGVAIGRSSVNPVVTSDQNCLCLLCRRTGHAMKDCSSYVPRRWNRSDKPFALDVQPRPFPPFPSLPDVPGSAKVALCERCRSSKAPSRLPMTCRRSSEGPRPIVEDTYYMLTIGRVPSLRLLSTCPLCRLIFSATYLSDKDLDQVEDAQVALKLISGKTIRRLEPDLYWGAGLHERSRYANCLYTWVGGREDHPDWSLNERMPEAIGLMESKGYALEVRQVNPKTPDYYTIKTWLRRCDMHHIACCPLVSEELKQIKLVDVETCQIVVYPAAGCDYVALSYVWGDVEQPTYRRGDVLPIVPATLEDAMVVTRGLGKRYLWVDSLCINQEDSMEKAVQITLMGAIYSGAWATIISLSGRSARDGLPRVGAMQGVVPQLSCEIWDKKLLSVMPTLSQQISWSPWTSRAWTYQEGLLSPRRLFFTRHQVYFECNTVQCCESLDDSNSPFHLQSDQERREALRNEKAVNPHFNFGSPQHVIGRGVLRDPFRPISNGQEAQEDPDVFVTYEKLVLKYTEKEMTRDADSLDAFSAMLTRLQERYYKRGFVRGLPLEALPRALTWYHCTLLRQRVDFPTWSWAGWVGKLHGFIVAEERSLLPPLRIWNTRSNGCAGLICNSNPIPGLLRKCQQNLLLQGIDLENNPVCYQVNKMFEKNPVAPPKIDKNELFIEGIVLRLSFSRSQTGRAAVPEWVGRCTVQLGPPPKPLAKSWKFYDPQLQVELTFHGGAVAELVKERSNREEEFLIVHWQLHNDHGSKPWEWEYDLLLIDRKGDYASRLAVATLILPDDEVERLAGCKPRKRLLRLR